MIVTLDPNGARPDVVGTVAAMVAERLGGRKKGYPAFILWVKGTVGREELKSALEEVVKKMRLPANAITIAQVDD